jgi:hypothetical protein
MDNRARVGRSFGVLILLGSVGAAVAVGVGTETAHGHGPEAAGATLAQSQGADGDAALLADSSTPSLLQTVFSYLAATAVTAFVLAWITLFGVSALCSGDRQGAKRRCPVIVRRPSAKPVSKPAWVAPDTNPAVPLASASG